MGDLLIDLHLIISQFGLGRQRLTQAGVTHLDICATLTVLIAGIELRNTTHGGHQHVADNDTTRVIILHYISKAVHIMVADKEQEVVGISIETIHGKCVIHARHTITPAGSVVLKGLANSFLHGEVHDGRQIGVETVKVLGVSLPISNGAGGTRPALTYNIDPRIVGTHSLAPT